MELMVIADGRFLFSWVLLILNQCDFLFSSYWEQRKYGNCLNLVKFVFVDDCNEF